MLVNKGHRVFYKSVPCAEQQKKQVQTIERIIVHAVLRLQLLILFMISNDYSALLVYNNKI